MKQFEIFLFNFEEKIQFIITIHCDVDASKVILRKNRDQY